MTNYYARSRKKWWKSPAFTQLIPYHHEEIVSWIKESLIVLDLVCYDDKFVCTGKSDGND